MVDHSTDAVRCAAFNTDLNDVSDRFTAIQSNVFEALPGQRFDVVIAHPPMIPPLPTKMLETAMFDPALSVLTAFLADLRDHLNDKGRTYVVYTDLLERHGQFDCKEDCNSNGLCATVLAEKPVRNETYPVYRLIKDVAT